MSWEAGQQGDVRSATLLKVMPNEKCKVGMLEGELDFRVLKIWRM